MPSQPNLQQFNNNQYQWFDTASGRYLQLQEQALYDLAVVDLFGFNAVQMGCPQMDLLRNSRIPHRYKSTDFPDASIKTDLQCCDDFLPFADSSLDLLLLPHRLEFSERPHQTLREAERVMMPEGHLLISGFNPFSLWGLVLVFKNIFSGRCSAKAFPWNSRFIGLTRLKDWLTLLGFEVVSVEICCHIPPFEQERWQRRFSFMDKIGSRWLSFTGGVYFIVAKKRVAGMTALKPSWKTPSLQSSLVPRPTQRKPSQNTAVKPDDQHHCEQ
jgi:SAM-dependent methyltransferase